MKSLLLKICNLTILISFFLLFFFVPLVLTPINFELFEYNKMMLTYALTVVIVAAWIMQMVLKSQIKIRRTPFDIPLILFLASQIISTIFSIDRHVSLYGYYSRFNGGLFSIISYILLYYAFVSNITLSQIKKLLITAVGSGVIVALYGIAEHFGIDKTIWVQDVQNRVFSTLGQPNWLAAYLAILIPIVISFALTSGKSLIDKSNQNLKINWSIGLLGYWVMGLLFYVTLIFTKSRSGFAAFWAVEFLFWLLLFFKFRQKIVKAALFINCALVIVNLFIGIPFANLDNFSLPTLLKGNTAAPAVSALPPAGSSVLDVGITESGTIRKIVWKGAIDIMRHYPLFGSGVETFAFSYYQYRPVEHNMTSEWDFLYNKAHNEYLNYGATTGLVGLGAYLSLIFAFIIWYLLKFKNQIQNGPLNSKVKTQLLDRDADLNLWILEVGLFSGWISILLTNFLGFSVVIIQIFFFLIPAMLVTCITDEKYLILRKDASTENSLNITQYFGVGIAVVAAIFFLTKLGTMWLSDVSYAKGYNLSRSGNYVEAYQALRNAINLNPDEPNYFDEISLVAGELSVAAAQSKDTTLSGELKNEALAASKLSISISPNNVNYYKTQTRLYYALAELDPGYMQNAIDALIRAHALSPTDPKIVYNLGLLYGRIGNSDQAIRNLKLAAALKPDYKDAHYALALMYKQNNQTDLAKRELEFILTRIATNDADAKKQLEELNK